MVQLSSFWHENNKEEQQWMILEGSPAPLLMAAAPCWSPQRRHLSAEQQQQSGGRLSAGTLWRWMQQHGSCMCVCVGGGCQNPLTSNWWGPRACWLFLTAPISIGQRFQDLMRIAERRDLGCCRPFSPTWTRFSMWLFHQHVAVEVSWVWVPKLTDASNQMEKVLLLEFDSRLVELS